MKYIDEYRDAALAKGLLKKIGKCAEQLKQPVTIMEVCGSHTQAIGRYGIRKLLPDNIRLISGPGCPVCVTAVHDVDIALFFAGQQHTIFATFGDMLRVPGKNGNSLQHVRASGADIRVVSSPVDCITLAEANQEKEIIFMGIGFETTAPTVAAMVMQAQRKGLRNISVFSAHKVIPPAMQALMSAPSIKIDGFLCPGHVSIIIGSDAYAFIPEAGKSAVITGFEPIDILEGILLILEQIAEQRPAVEIQYSRGVSPAGNPKARAVMQAVFSPYDAEWRGLGTIPRSGLVLQDAYQTFDSLKRYSIPEIISEEIGGCSCGDILRGAKTPDECLLFKKACTPVNPIGPCMVSSEGSCAAYYKYQ